MVSEKRFKIVAYLVILIHVSLFLFANLMQFSFFEYKYIKLHNLGPIVLSLIYAICLILCFISVFRRRKYIAISLNFLCVILFVMQVLIPIGAAFHSQTTQSEYYMQFDEKIHKLSNRFTQINEDGINFFPSEESIQNINVEYYYRYSAFMNDRMRVMLKVYYESTAEFDAIKNELLDQAYLDVTYRNGWQILMIDYYQSSTSSPSRCYLIAFNEDLQQVLYVYQNDYIVVLEWIDELIS